MLGLVIKIEVQLMGLDTRGSAQGLEHKVILWKYLWAIFLPCPAGMLTLSSPRYTDLSRTSPVPMNPLADTQLWSRNAGQSGERSSQV